MQVPVHPIGWNFPGTGTWLLTQAQFANGHHVTIFVSIKLLTNDTKDLLAVW